MEKILYLCLASSCTFVFFPNINKAKVHFTCHGFGSVELKELLLLDSANIRKYYIIRVSVAIVFKQVLSPFQMKSIFK